MTALAFGYLPAAEALVRRGARVDNLAVAAGLGRLADAGAGEPYVTTPEEFATRMKGDYEKYGKLIRSIGVKVE